MKRLVASLLVVGIGSGTFLAQESPPAVKPAGYTAPNHPEAVPVVKVEFAAKPTANGAELLPKMLSESRAALAKTRDYTGHLVRQERVNGALTPEQVAELRVRSQPFTVNVKTTKPLALAGEETSYAPAKSTLTARFRPAGLAGVKGFQTVEAHSAKALANTRHPASEVGFAALVERVEKMLAVEKQLKNPVQVFAGEYTIAGKPVTRFEIIAERQHPARYAQRCLVFIENDSKLPVRFEAYDAPKAGTTDGELIEVQSYIGVKTNVGLGDRDFDR